MSNQFFADLDLAMQPLRDAQHRVIEAARDVDAFPTSADRLLIMRDALVVLDDIQHKKSKTRMCRKPVRNKGGSACVLVPNHIGACE